VSDVEAIGKRRPRRLSLSPAAELLGVDATTLRGWADAGRVRVFRTPGGHRRFDPVDLESLLQESPPFRTGTPVLDESSKGALETRQWLASRSWYSRIDEYSRTRVRTCCTELMRVLAAYTAGRPDRRQDLERARLVGTALGREVAGWGLTPAESTEAFLHFKRHVTEALASPPVDALGQVRMMRDADAVLGEFLQAVMEAYQMAGGLGASLPGP
jgi:excisionase family DNA binding protein